MVGWKIVLMRAHGTDAERYLQNRLTNDVKRLAPGQTCWAAALTPQGKTQALFQVQRIDKESFFLLCDGGNVEELKAALLRFKVADRITVDEVPDSYAMWVEGSQATAGSELHFVRPIGSKNGTLIVGSAEALKPFCTPQAVSSEAEYAILCAEQMFPRFPIEIQEKYLFSESGFECAVSFNKGCYVGQEVVHKIDAFAVLPYELGVLAFAAQAEIVPGDKLQVQGENCGEVVSVVKTEAAVLTFVRIRTERQQFESVTGRNHEGALKGICHHE